MENRSSRKRKSEEAVLGEIPNRQKKREKSPENNEPRLQRKNPHTKTVQQHKLIRVSVKIVCQIIQYCYNRVYAHAYVQKIQFTNVTRLEREHHFLPH